MIEAELAANFVRHIEDSRANGLPELHFRLWNRADAQAKDEYVQRFRSDPDAMAWYPEGFLGDDPDFDLWPLDIIDAARRRLHDLVTTTTCAWQE